MHHGLTKSSKTLWLLIALAEIGWLAYFDHAVLTESPQIKAGCHPIKGEFLTRATNNRMALSLLQPVIGNQVWEKPFLKRNAGGCYPGFRKTNPSI